MQRRGKHFDTFGLACTLNENWHEVGPDSCSEPPGNIPSLERELEEG